MFVSSAQAQIDTRAAARQGKRDWDLVVNQLGSESYHERTLASRRLAVAGGLATESLERGLRSEDAEIRWACRRLLSQWSERRITLELERLVHDYDPSDRYQLDGWTPFRKACGDASEARAFYCRLVKHQRSFMAWLERVEDDDDYDIENQLDDQNRFLSPDAQRLKSGDPICWSMLLLAAANPKVSQVPVLGSHIRCGLQSPSTIKGLTQNPCAPVTRQLVRHWILQQSRGVTTRTTLRIAALYDFGQLSEELCQQILASPSSSPAVIQSAMLTLAAVNPEAAADELPGFLTDRRVCQIWQIMASRRRAVQTQLGDTAMALLMHCRGIDPRDAGFLDLQADPLNVYREQSLGFETENQRSKAHRIGLLMLGLASD